MKRGLTTIIITAIVAGAVIIIAGAGYYVYQNNKIATTTTSSLLGSGVLKKPAVTTKISNPTSQVATTAKVGQAVTTAALNYDWKTHRNDKYGFEINYPGSFMKNTYDARYMLDGFTWYIKDNPGKDVLGSALLVDDEDEGWYSTYTPRLKWSDDLTFETITEKSPIGIDSLKTKGQIVDIGGKKAYKINSDNGVSLLYVINNKHVLRFIFSVSSPAPDGVPVSKEEAMRIINEMISSIKFF